MPRRVAAPTLVAGFPGVPADENVECEGRHHEPCRLGSASERGRRRPAL
jgi:hypothetical protein